MPVFLVDDPGAGKRTDERPGVAAEQLGAQRIEELRATLELLRTEVFLAAEE
ncbi:MAG TPA: hypothetical protein VJT80_15720 [Steroidobacteraceae bacterium]|nr:hypothetical protein [Steroidobacteraceae bacterium]